MAMAPKRPRSAEEEPDLWHDLPKNWKTDRKQFPVRASGVIQNNVNRPIKDEQEAWNTYVNDDRHNYQECLISAFCEQMFSKSSPAFGGRLARYPLGQVYGPSI